MNDVELVVGGKLVVELGWARAHIFLTAHTRSVNCEPAMNLSGICFNII